MVAISNFGTVSITKRKIAGIFMTNHSLLNKSLGRSAIERSTMGAGNERINPRTKAFRRPTSTQNIDAWQCALCERSGDLGKADRTDAARYHSLPHATGRPTGHSRGTQQRSPNIGPRRRPRLGGPRAM